MIYFNNAATTYPKPEIVNDAVRNYLLTPPIDSARSGLERETMDQASLCRANLAKILNISNSDRIIFTSGSTESLNLAINGLELDGGHVVSTMIEHNSMIRPLKHLEMDGKIELDFVECDSNSYVSPETIESAIKPNTKAIMVNHCSNVTGSILDIKSIAKVAHRHGAMMVVDASQSAGAIDIHAEEWGIDLLAFTGHKSLFGLAGIGGIYIKDGVKLKPLKVGGTGVKSEVLTQPEMMPLYYEAGTPNHVGIASLRAGTEFILDKGIDTIHKRKSDIIKYIIEQLENYPEIQIYTSIENNLLSNFCFNIDKLVPEEVGYILDSSYDIIVRTGLHCAPLLLKPVGVYPWGTVRASPSYFTTDVEVDTFITAVKEIISTFVRKDR